MPTVSTMDTVPPGYVLGRPGTMPAKASVEFRPRGISLAGMLNLIRPVARGMHHKERTMLWSAASTGSNAAIAAAGSPHPPAVQYVHMALTMVYDDTWA